MTARERTVAPPQPVEHSGGPVTGMHATACAATLHGRQRRAAAAVLAGPRTCSSVCVACVLWPALASAHSVPLSSWVLKEKARGAASSAIQSNRREGWWPSCRWGGGWRVGQVRCRPQQRLGRRRVMCVTMPFVRLAHTRASAASCERRPPAPLPPHTHTHQEQGQPISTCAKAQAMLNISCGLRSHTRSSASWKWGGEGGGGGGVCVWGGGEAVAGGGGGGHLKRHGL
jgi:uncharacterized membrane protein YgcG